MTKRPKNLAISVLDRLNNLARSQGKPHQELLQYYAIERFLYRLSKSTHRNNFVLKGGVVFIAWRIPLRRPTKDIDFYGQPPLDIVLVEDIVKDICQQSVAVDGIQFDAASVQGEAIQGRADIQGVRIRFTGYIGSARLPMQIDVGFADTVVPPAIELSYPSLLDMPEPNLRAYTYETLIAEKFQAMVFLGTINTRMKDFHDIWLLSAEAKINGASLYDSLTTTFKSRGTDIPTETPVSLTQAFAQSKQQDWQAFVRRANVGDTTPNDFVEVVDRLYDFLMPILEAVRLEMVFPQHWTAESHWQ